MTTPELKAATTHLMDLVGMTSEPLVLVYADEQPVGFRPEVGQRACMLAIISRARRGETIVYDAEHIGCPGAGYYLGFCEPSPQVDYFVSTGIQGRMEGEHYKKSPELMRQTREKYPPPPAAGKYAAVKPLAALDEQEQPQVVIAFVTPDELCGLVMLAGYARSDDAALCAFAAGCGAIVTRPLIEAQRPQPRAVVGIFDPSARIFMRPQEMTFAAPRALWEEMTRNADESFLHTPTWGKLRQRIRAAIDQGHRRGLRTHAHAGPESPGATPAPPARDTG